MSDRAKHERKAFLRIDEDPLDDAAERVALANNIPTLTPPGFEKVPEIAPTMPPAAARPSGIRVPQGQPLRDSGIRNSVAIAAPRDTPERQAFKYVRIRLPFYLDDQLAAEQQRLREAGRHVTVNYLIMSALKTAGFHLEESDLVEDGRRFRS